MVNESVVLCIGLSFGEGKPGDLVLDDWVVAMRRLVQLGGRVLLVIDR